MNNKIVRRKSNSKSRHLSGQRFGTLTALDLICEPTKYGFDRLVYTYKCDCGSTGKMAVSDLKVAKSCGCQRAAGVARAVTTHGMSRTAIYQTWATMIARCHRPTAKKYAYYGARGISVYPEWRKSFSAFYEHVGEKPTPSHTLDRIDNSGNYEPGNVKWATKKEQQSNTRTVTIIRYGGADRPLPEVADECGISRQLLYSRIFTLGWSVERATTEPKRYSNRVY